MSKFSRREFLESGGLTALGASLLGCQSPAPEGFARVDGPTPDFIVTNANVITVDEERPAAQAFAVKNGRFAAVGSNADIESIASTATQSIDAQGATVTPGFIDAHCHPGGVRELTGVNVNLRTIDEIKRAMAAKAEVTREGYWVTGYMYDDTKLDDGRPVTRRDLDEAVPNHPAMIGHRGGHTGVYNSVAFRLAGVTVDTPDPPGGAFYREDGELTGKVAERARGVFNGIGLREEVTRETNREGVEFISQEMSKAGLTSVHQTGGGMSSLRALQDAYRAGNMRFRMYFFPRGGLFQTLKEAGIYTGFGDEWLRIGAVKFGADGSASERTMRMSTPYVGRPNDYGILTMTEEEIDEAVEDAHRHDFQIGIHANGDVTIDLVLKAYERMQREFPREDPRHRIEHCSLVNPDLLRRIKAVGAIPTPFYTYVHYHGNKWLEYGEEKMRWMFAHKSFLDYDIPVAPASDYMPGPYEPLMAIQSMVTRKDFQGRVWGPNQRITVDQAIRICTYNGAYASFEENVKGTITPGKYADFVMLAEDPRSVDPDRIKEIPVLRTVVGGRTMWET